jgi:hypothetical protein
MKAIRAHLAELAIDSLIPIDRTRLTLGEERAPGMPPRLVLALQTVEQFGCLGHYIDHDMRLGGVDSIYLNLHGVAAPAGPCPAAIGPATMSRELSLRPGKYKLLVTYRRRADRLIVDLSDSATAITGLDSALVEADERPRCATRPTASHFAAETWSGRGPCAPMPRPGWLDSLGSRGSRSRRAR